MTHLFSKLELRAVTIRNRIAISPMCTYSAQDGLANDFHLAHYGRFGLGGAGLVMIEATSVSPEGRISHGDLGLWSDEHIAPLARIVKVLKDQGATVGIQLCHAGRKANRQRPWHGNGPISADDLARGEGLWPLKAPSPIAFGNGYQVPEELSVEEIARTRQYFKDAVRRADEACFDIIELHGAHGFLLHSFMSPVTNKRADAYGGDFDGRYRFAFEVVDDTRALWPDEKPLFVRVSALDGVDGGRDFDETVQLAAALRKRGVDVIDCSSGGIGGHSASTSPAAREPRGFGFQVPYAERIRKETGIATMAVGLITEPHFADSIIAEGRSDLVAIGREALMDPNWALHAEATLGRLRQEAPFESWPVQYGWWLNGRHKMLASQASR